MNGNDEINQILLEILRVGLLRIRVYGSSGDGDACCLEADHLHNLPALIQTFHRELLLFYYDVERPAFLRATTREVDAFTKLWDRLGKMIEQDERGKRRAKRGQVHLENGPVPLCPTDFVPYDN